MASALFGAVAQRSFLSRLYQLDHLYGLFFTFGMALTLEVSFGDVFGASGRPFAGPEIFMGSVNLGSCSCPNTGPGFSLASGVVCRGVWLVTQRSKIGSHLRAATENAALVQLFGINLR